MKKNNKLVMLSAVMLIVLACTFSFGGSQLSEAEELQTVVAQTVSAKLEEDETLAPLPTITLAPTATPKSDPTQTPKPCNKAEFISETIPDDTPFDAGESFTKTWRLKNVGTCTWNTNYKLTFFSGDKMNGPSEKNLTQNVAPGEQIDISVDLKAPGSAGTYDAVWKIKDDDGAFYVNYITVKIKVANAPLNNYSVTLDAVPAEGGSVWGNGDENPGDYAVGDAVGNHGVQLFAAFDISGIPSSAQITEVKVDFTNFLVLGDPFGDLGCLRVYEDPYRPMNAGDYTPPPVTGELVRWCSSAQLGSVTVESDLADYLQSRLDTDWMPIRLQFNDKQTDNNNDKDAVGFFNMSIDVKYKAP
jgi:hypothetical protein